MPWRQRFIVVIVFGIRLFIIITRCVALGNHRFLPLLEPRRRQLGVATGDPEERSKEKTQNENLSQTCFHDPTLTPVKRFVNRFIYYNIGANQSVPDIHQNPHVSGESLIVLQLACAD
jgi:hypothetical protein